MKWLDPAKPVFCSLSARPKKSYITAACRDDHSSKTEGRVFAVDYLLSHCSLAVSSVRSCEWEHRLIWVRAVQTMQGPVVVVECMNTVGWYYDDNPPSSYSRRFRRTALRFLKPEKQRCRVIRFLFNVHLGLLGSTSWSTEWRMLASLMPIGLGFGLAPCFAKRFRQGNRDTFRWLQP